MEQGSFLKGHARFCFWFFGDVDQMLVCMCVCVCECVCVTVSSGLESMLKARTTSFAFYTTLKAHYPLGVCQQWIPWCVGVGVLACSCVDVFPLSNPWHRGCVHILLAVKICHRPRMLSKRAREDCWISWTDGCYCCSLSSSTLWCYLLFTRTPLQSAASELYFPLCYEKWEKEGSLVVISRSSRARD